MKSKNAEFVRKVGATFTKTAPFWRHPYAYKDSRGNWKIALGKYRCDTFVVGMYGTGGVRYTRAAIYPKLVYDAFPNKR